MQKIDKLDVLRRERHLTLYDSRDHISKERVNERMVWCMDFYQKTIELIGDES